MATRKYPARGNPAPGVSAVDSKYLQQRGNIWRNNFIVKSSKHFQFFFVSLWTLDSASRGLEALLQQCPDRQRQWSVDTRVKPLIHVLAGTVISCIGLGS